MFLLHARSIFANKITSFFVRFCSHQRKHLPTFTACWRKKSVIFAVYTTPDKASLYPFGVLCFPTVENIGGLGYPMPVFRPFEGLKRHDFRQA